MTYEVQRKTLLEKIDLVRHGQYSSTTLAIELFSFQRSFNPIYFEYLKIIGKEDFMPDKVMDIPFLPISTFKHRQVKTGDWDAEMVFLSSGTAGQQRSKSHVRNLSQYYQNCKLAFEEQYGSLEEYCFLALLPSYLEQGSSSLVQMVHHFIQDGGHPQSGFYRNLSSTELSCILQSCHEVNSKVLLIGVTYALLDLAESIGTSSLYKDLIIMETGGMKGRRVELTKVEIHSLLAKAFGVEHIHSEYGMTELFSQAYSTHSGIFWPSSTIQVVLNSLNDPFDILPIGQGQVNIVDLANIDTCCFIKTEDVGQIHVNGSFQLMGRIENSDIRGCNLLFTSDTL